MFLITRRTRILTSALSRNLYITRHTQKLCTIPLEGAQWKIKSYPQSRNENLSLWG